eukprot:11069473-Alexandrium_andersonii.AAC.1
MVRCSAAAHPQAREAFRRMHGLARRRPPSADEWYPLGSQLGWHAVRVAARSRLICQAGTLALQRNDAEGIGGIFLETQSHPLWTQFRSSLGASDRL